MENKANPLLRQARDDGFSYGEIARGAGMSTGYICRIANGVQPLTDKAARRIGHSLSELKRERQLAMRDAALSADDFRRPWKSRAAAQYRMAVAHVALAAGVAPGFILAADPARRATADPDWLRAARLRQVALYIANQFLHIGQAELARAASMTKSNVCIALKRIEDQRGNADLEAMLATVEGAFQP